MNMDYMEFSAKTVNDAVTEACKHFTVPSDKLEYVVVEEGSTGFLGFNSKPAVIKARVIEEELSVEDQEDLIEFLKIRTSHRRINITP